MLGVKSATGAKGPVVPWPEVTVLVLSWLRLDLGVSVIPRLSEWGQLFLCRKYCSSATLACLCRISCRPLMTLPAKSDKLNSLATFQIYPRFFLHLLQPIFIQPVFLPGEQVPVVADALRGWTLLDENWLLVHFPFQSKSVG